MVRVWFGYRYDMCMVRIGVWSGNGYDRVRVRVLLG